MHDAYHCGAVFSIVSVARIIELSIEVSRSLLRNTRNSIIVNDNDDPVCYCSGGVVAARSRGRSLSHRPVREDRSSISIRKCLENLRSNNFKDKNHVFEIEKRPTTAHAAGGLVAA